MEKNLKQQQSDCLKIVLFGPESTGKSTLCKNLAKHYKTIHAPEFSRTYLQNKWDTKKEICTKKDMLPIAYGQMESENRLTKKANKILFCDTNLLELKVYSQVYYENYVDPLIEKYATENLYDLYLLTDIDIPWEKDDLRDKPYDREFMFNQFKTCLEKHNLPYRIIKGKDELRLQNCISYISQLL